jgi:colanic acid/amylovoran biosynthesis glycosyltransferase
MIVMSLAIAYLINQYPKVSHSFVRREIHGLEACGVSVHRFSVRSRSDELVDEIDKAELQKTDILLQVGLKGLLLGMVRVMVQRPGAWLRALQLAIAVGWNSERGLLLHVIYLAEACVLLTKLAATPVTHVHSHFGTNSTTVAMLCHALGGPAYSFTVHGPEEFDKVQAIALPEKIRRAAFVVAISSYGRSQLYRWCQAEDWPKIHIVHCGVDDYFLNPATTPIPDAPNLVCVARLSEQKGHLLLLEAAHQLAAAGQDFHLTLVGDGELRSQIEAKIQAYGLTERITITGWASSGEVQRHILNSRAFILPSFAEGLPVVIMEALALHRPVLSTYVAGIPELVEPGDCGWLVPAGSIKALTEALTTLLKTPTEELQAMGDRGALRVQAQHNALTEAQHLAQLFQAAAQPDTPGSAPQSIDGDRQPQPSNAYD